MKHTFLIIAFAAFLGACSEDVSHDITTDLTQEADQFFLLSETLHESSYLGNLSFGEYFLLNSPSLPGCPSINYEPELSQIILDYSSVDSCSQTNTALRSGKIVLDFSLANVGLGSWSMVYENYSYEKTTVEGTRWFKKVSAAQNSESFENLKIRTENDLGFTISGDYTYFITRLNNSPIGISYAGRHEGVNPVGRQFVQSITEAKEVLFSCYSDGWVLPIKGKENWKVARGKNEVGYQVSYSTAEDCLSDARAVLPDGRNYDLNP